MESDENGTEITRVNSEKNTTKIFLFILENVKVTKNCGNKKL